MVKNEEKKRSFSVLRFFIIYSQSTSLSDAMYDLDWYDIPVQDARLLLIFMSRAQKPLVLTAGRFYVFSLKSFMDVSRLLLSFFI
uniref:Odorant receptor 32 n=1 Tax=Sirex noctilio TaxID=36765 RepID=A0A857N3K5_9HYME|nr:odorant receptor 32 [Sirex noctilio]